MRLILHIGRHKSGTSSIQHWLKRNNDLLSTNGILYPKSFRKGVAHHNLVDILDPRKSDAADLDFVANQILHEVTEEDTIILSSEAFQNVNDLTHVRRFIDKIGPVDVSIICFFREHIDYSISAFRQMIQNQTRDMSFSDYIKRFRDMEAFLQSWSIVGDLKASWLSSPLGEPRDVVELFLNSCKLGHLYRRQEWKNVSIGGNLLVFKATSNKLRIDGIKYRDLELLAIEEKRFSEPFHVSDDAAKRFRASSAYNDSLVRHLGPVFLKSWSQQRKLPDFESLEHDIYFIGDKLGIEITDTFYSTAYEIAPAFRLSC